MKLVKFLQKLNREQVTIELKNGTVISGTVVGVDATMNAHLKKAKMTVRGKNPVSYATLSVRGSTVRAWLLPDGLNLDALLVEDTPKVSIMIIYTLDVCVTCIIIFRVLLTHQNTLPFERTPKSFLICTNNYTTNQNVQKAAPVGAAGRGRGRGRGGRGRGPMRR